MALSSLCSILSYDGHINPLGGGTSESRRAIELSELLGVNVLPSQVVIFDIVILLLCRMLSSLCAERDADVSGIY